jgi:pyruvate/2-oxoglutarate dehydrogenase complex dihydrolipoamide acyltransferase (E2) component
MSLYGGEVKEVKMPEWGAGMDEGGLLKWLKKEGEEISAGDPIAKIQPDNYKSPKTLKAEHSGKLAQLITQEGEYVPVGAPIAFIASEDEEVGQVAASTDQETMMKTSQLIQEKLSALVREMTDQQKEEFLRNLPHAAQEQGERAGSVREEGVEQRTSKSASPTRRLNVVFSESAYNTLKDLADESGKTISDVVRDAIALQRWFNGVRREGGRILVEQRGRVREIMNIR